MEKEIVMFGHWSAIILLGLVVLTALSASIVLFKRAVDKAAARRAADRAAAEEAAAKAAAKKSKDADGMSAEFLASQDQLLGAQREQNKLTQLLLGLLLLGVILGVVNLGLHLN